MIKLRLILCLLGSLILHKSKAQPLEKVNYGYIPELRISVLSPASIFDFKPFMEASVEKKLNQRHSIEVALGVYLPKQFSDIQLTDFDKEIYRSGFRLRINWKRFDLKKVPNSNTYIAPEFMFNYYAIRNTAWYSRYTDAYQQYLTVKTRTTIVGFGFKIGEQSFTPNNRFYADYFAALGVRMLVVAFKDAPEDIDIVAETSEIVSRKSGTYFHPYLSVGLKLGIVLKK
jgi:hypothetical protein